MGEVNKYGLSRYIPAGVASQVRRECGFGCVVCGKSVVDYEHIDPEFADAHSHEPGRIALLCGGCHDNVTRRIWSKEKIRQARANPFCKKKGFSWGGLDTGLDVPGISFGNNFATNIGPIFQIDDTVLFGTLPPEEPGAPFRLTARFFDEESRPTMQIVDNEWKLNVGATWDFKHVGPRIKIHGANSKDRLELLIAGQGHIVIERMNFTFNGVTLMADRENFLFRSDTLGMRVFTDCSFHHHPFVLHTT